MTARRVLKLLVAMLVASLTLATPTQSYAKKESKEARQDRKTFERLASYLGEEGFRGAFGFSGPGGQMLSQTKVVDRDTQTALTKALQTGGAPDFAAMLEQLQLARTWPWASVTKQVLSILVMQQLEDGSIGLDVVASEYLPELAGAAPAPTVRQLLRHQSGLRNPDATQADAQGVPSFYRDGPTGIEWCLEGRDAVPTEGWSYNNCDYIVLGALLERVTGTDLESLISDRIGKVAGWSRTRMLGVGSELKYFGMSEDYSSRIARYGASAALVGPIEELLAFDRALLKGELLSSASRDVLWQGDAALGYMALGQWAFEAPLKGCDSPVRLVERRGGIGKYQIRNIIIPDRGFALVLMTEQEDFDFGEIWMGEGFMFDALSAVACR